MHVCVTNTLCGLDLLTHGLFEVHEVALVSRQRFVNRPRVAPTQKDAYARYQPHSCVDKRPLGKWGHRRSVWVVSVCTVIVPAANRPIVSATDSKVITVMGP